MKTPPVYVVPKTHAWNLAVTPEPMPHEQLMILQADYQEVLKEVCTTTQQALKDCIEAIRNQDPDKALSAAQDACLVVAQALIAINAPKIKR